MTIKELFDMKIHEEHKFAHSLERCFRIVIRVPGGWIYETGAYKNGVYTGGMTSCFVPEPNLQTIALTDSGYDEWLAAVESDLPEPEPDYDKTFQSEKDFLTMGRFS